MTAKSPAQMPTPSVAAFDNFVVNAKNTASVVPWVLYDNLAYAAAGQTQLTFFQRAAGNGTVTLADTNMQVASQLPAPQEFLVTKIEFQFHSGVTPGSYGAGAAPELINDVDAVLNSGYVQFFVGQGLYVQDSPLIQFPAENRLAVAGFAADTSTAAAAQQTMAQYAAGAGMPRDDGPFAIPPSQNFRVSVNWPTAVAPPSGTGGVLRCRMHGWLKRAVQG